MQEHEYKARDKTVQKMSRDGLREKNLRNKEEKRITGRDMDTEVSRSEKKDELDFSKRRRDHINERRETEHPEQSSKKIRYSRESISDEKSEQDIDGELDGEQVADESTATTKSAFRSESIRGQPRGERAYLETAADSRDLRKKKMVRDYASKERRKEKEASEESKTAKREAARYRETSEVAEESLDGFSEEIKGKSKRERVLKEQRKKSSRLSFGDESDGMVHGAGIGIRSSASAVKDAVATAAHWKTHEAEDDNAAVEGAHRAELAGESLARKSIYTRERLKQRREQSKRLKESVLDEAEKSRLMFESVYGNEAKNMVKKEAEQKRKSALQKLFQMRRQNCLTIATFGAMIFNIIFNILLIPKFGACGAAIASVGSEIVTLVIQCYFGKEYINFILLIKNIVKYLGASVIMYICISVLKSLLRNYIGMFVITLVLITFGIVIYFLIMLFIKDETLIGLNKYKQSDRC